MIETGIAVTGTGEVEGRPDTVRIQIGVSVTRKSVADATSDAAALAHALMATLLAAGVAERDVQTANLSVNPNYEYPPNRQPKLTGYTFTNTLFVVIRDIDAAGSIIDRAITTGGDNAVLHGISFALADDAAALVAAREAAFADARAKAEQLAGLAGVALGPAVAIEELERGAFPTPPSPKLMRMAAADAGPPPVAAGQVTTTVQVSVRFAIT
jgi:uncharacterized protein YggE